MKTVISDIVYQFFRVTGYLPTGLLKIISFKIKYLLFNILKYRNSTIRSNIANSLSSLTAMEREAVRRKFQHHFSRLFPEILFTQSRPAEKLKQLVRLANHSEADTLALEKGSRVICLTSHHNNWEFMNLFPLWFQAPVYAVYKPVSSKFSERIANRIRTRFGVRLLTMAQAPKFVLKAGGNAGIYLFISDQNPHTHLEAYKTTFLDQPSYFFPGGIKLAQREDLPLFYISSRKNGFAGYTFTFVKLRMPGEQVTDRELLERYVSLLETDIRQQPETYLWSHRRWKP